MGELADAPEETFTHEYVDFCFINGLTQHMVGSVGNIAYSEYFSTWYQDLKNT